VLQFSCGTWPWDLVAVPSPKTQAPAGGGGVTNFQHQRATLPAQGLRLLAIQAAAAAGDNDVVRQQGLIQLTHLGLTLLPGQGAQAANVGRGGGFLISWAGVGAWGGGILMTGLEPAPTRTARQRQGGQDDGSGLGQCFLHVLGLRTSLMEPPYAADETPTVRIMVKFLARVCREPRVSVSDLGTTMPFPRCGHRSNIRNQGLVLCRIRSRQAPSAPADR
jgi:hypothetical protein